MEFRQDTWTIDNPATLGVVLAGGVIRDSVHAYVNGVEIRAFVTGDNVLLLPAPGAGGAVEARYAVR